MIGILADDSTGANDIGVAYQKGGAGVKVIVYEEDGILELDEDALVVDTNSRFDSPKVAYEKVYSATRSLKAAGCRRFHKKTCSVFRGNVGAEFDAMLDATGLSTMIVSVAYPGNRRSTINGIHYVNGVLIEESNFRKDPVHPTTKSNLVEIIREQSDRPSMVVPIGEVRKGAQALKLYLEAIQHQFTYLIVDGETQEDIATLAEAACGFSAFGGSAAIGGELSPFFGEMNGPRGIDRSTLSGSGACLVVCGSLTPQTREQTTRLLATGVIHSEFVSTNLFDQPECAAWLQKTVALGRRTLANGSDFLIHASQDPDTVAATKVLARSNRLDDAGLGRRISTLLATAAARILENAPPYSLIVAGGDTAGSVCERMGIKGNRIIEEIDTGIPIGQTLTHPRLIVLKSGGFGKPDFLIRAIRRLHEIYL